jgi:uncharacterized RDD family membrane protein YckC
MKNSADNTQKVFGRRIIAAILDIILWSIVFAVASTNFGTVTHVVNNGVATAQASLTGVPSFIFIVAAIAYFVLLEWRVGSTLGKLACGLRVTNMKGEPITFRQSLTRNLFRIVDGFPYIIPYLTGIIIMASGAQSQRLGDKVADSLVVKR